MIRKLMIIPWFGDLPAWFAHWDRNRLAALSEHGYDFLVTEDLRAFKRRVKARLGVQCPIVPNEGKIHDYRCAFGLLYAKQLDGYDFWGHTDLDVVYGRVHRFVTDEFLDILDIHSNHVDYIAGPWTLYRNVPAVNELFMASPVWRDALEAPDVNGWVEKEFTRVVDEAHEAGYVRRAYTTWQTRNLDNFTACRLHPDGRLTEGQAEVMMLHFRRTKEYPAGCLPA